jgi:hypothetical protein
MAAGTAASASAGPSSEPAPSPAPAPQDDREPNTLFVKIERLRRIRPALEYIYTVRHGEDRSFGLGLTEDNEIIKFYHEENSNVLRIGDQVRAVNDAPLVREKLAALLQRKFPGEESVKLHISRPQGAGEKHEDTEVFCALQQRSRRGEDLDEWLTELWDLRTDAVWGTFFTVPIVHRANSMWLGLHASYIFSEPLLGCVSIPLSDLGRDELDTRWHSLRAQDASGSTNELVGEVLLTTRKYVSNVSISPGEHWLHGDEMSDEEPEGPIDHATEPLAPIDDQPIPEWIRRIAMGGGDQPVRDDRRQPHH